MVIFKSHIATLFYVSILMTNYTSGYFSILSLLTGNKWVQPSHPTNQEHIARIDDGADTLIATENHNVRTFEI